MDMNEDGSIEELQCRICAQYITDDNGIMHIFEEDARKNYLRTKIKKYLYILVSANDSLPKMVCVSCVKQLERIHRFAMTAHRAQERLKIQYYRSSDNVKYEEFGDRHAKGNHQRLLRSMLVVKTGRDMDNITPSSPLDLPILPEVTANVMEEMEVKVDPMVFLQYDTERSQSPEACDSDSDKYKKCDYEIKDVANTVEEHYVQRTHQNILKRKIKEKHHHNTEESTNTESFNCEFCDGSFRSQAILQNHLWLHCLSAKCHYNDYTDDRASDNNCGSFVCPICNKKISTKGNLKVHLETHRPKGKYGCDICGRIFKTQSNLFRHKEYHSGIQFPCSVCGRVYPTNSTLRAHSITHSNLRPHSCPLCDKTFKRNQDLKFHINQHTGARPYQCPYCPKAFASSGNCFSHRKRMHPKEVHRDRQRAVDLMQ